MLVSNLGLFPWPEDEICHYTVHRTPAPPVSDGRRLPPQPGDNWRMDFSRFNQYQEATPARDSGGWAWSPHGVWDSHVPELFPYMHFSIPLLQFRCYILQEGSFLEVLNFKEAEVVKVLAGCST